MATPDELREKLRKMREAQTPPPVTEPVAEPTKPTPDDLRAKLKAMRAESPTPTPDARSRRDYASAHPEETLAAVEIARAQVERTLIEDGMEPNAARAKSFRDAAGMMLTRPSRAAEANIRASEEMPSLTGTATRVLAPGVRAVEPHPTTKQDREAQYRSEVRKIDASLENLQGAVDAFHTAWEGSTPPMSAEDYKASVGDKDWLQGAKQAVENIGRMNIGTVTFGLLGDLPTVDRLKAQASLIGDVIDNLSTDADLPKVVSFEGYGEIAKRAAVKAGAPDAAAFVGEHLGLLKPREANALRQDAIDARPAEHFDMLAPRIHEAATSDDPEAWSAGLDALLSLPPSIIPDKDVINSPDVARFRAAIEATPDAFDDEAWAGVKQRVKQKAGDTEVELALRQVPLGALVGVQPDLMPDMNAIARLVERREAARKKWGGATTEALERLVTAAAITPATKDGQPVYVESTPAQVMRLAGTAFEMLAEADVPAYDLNPTAWAIAAIGDAAGAKDFTAHVRNARLPTKRGLDVMLSTGAYDDMLAMAGLGPYRPLLGNDSSSWGARVLADVIYPEFQGLGLSATAERAGMDPTSTLATTLDVIDLGAGFIVPAEEWVAAPVGIAARAGLRARQGARAMPKGYKLRGALAKAAPSAWSAFSGEKLLDIDGDTALHHALLSAVEQETKAGREVKIPAPYWDSVKAAARSIGADPDALLAEVKKSLELRRARTFENMQDMVAREATPEMEALRQHPEYVRVANELDAMVRAGVMPADKALGELMLEEVRAFLTVQAGIYASPEDYFASVQREVGGTSGAGAYFSGAPIYRGAPLPDHIVALADDLDAAGFPIKDDLSEWADDPGTMSLDEYAAATLRDIDRGRSETGSGITTAHIAAMEDRIAKMQAELSAREGITETEAHAIGSPSDIRAMGDETLAWKLEDEQAYLSYAQETLADEDAVYAGLKEKARRLMEELRAARIGTDAYENVQSLFHSTIGGKQTEQGTIERVVRQPAPTFYSALRRTVEGIKQERFTAEQLRGMLAGKVKADEIEWTGLERFLAEHPKPTKSEVLGWLDENAVVVEERELGRRKLRDNERLPPADGQRWLALRDREAMGSLTDPERAELDALEQRRVALLPPPMLDTHYSGYQLPGGTNYREVLFKLPEGGDASANLYNADIRQRDGRWFVYDTRTDRPMDGFGEYATRGEAQSASEERLTKYQLPAYQAPHFGDEGRNLLAHTRLSDRVGPNGEKILHVEEIQSDWHQAGREKGYKGVESPAEKELMAFNEEMIAKYGTEHPDDYLDFMTPEEGATFNRLEAAAGTDDMHRVPAAPFAKSWHELVMKRILREAAENGYDGVSWTTGVQQVKRYEDATRQAVDEIRWSREGNAPATSAEIDRARADYERVLAENLESSRSNDPTERSIANQVIAQAWGRVEALEETLDAESAAPNGQIHIIGSKNGREVYRETMPPEKVVDVLGKGMAAKIAESPEASGSLTGADLTIGGEGMKGFYDQILPSFVQKYTKKWGGRVGDIAIDAAGTAEPVHYLPLTPPMRDALLYEGQPLFQKVGPTIRGSIEPRTVGYLQRFFQTADFNTLLHEDGHLLRFLFGDRWTSELAKHFEHTVDPQGFTVLTRKGEEQAAEALRLYMRSRTHPNGRLRAKLEDSYYALQDLYLRMRGQTPNLPVELRAMWDATLRPDDAIRPSAILLADREIPGPRPMSLLPPRTPEGDIVAVGENRMARAGRKAEAEKVLVDRARVRQAIGLPEAVQEVDPEKLLGQLIAFVGVERARQGIQGEDWVKLTDRSMVPRGRLERIQRAVKGDLRLVLGTDDWLPLIDEANQTIRLDAPQAAAMRGLITDLANEPYGATLPRSVLDFDGNPGTMAIEDWNTVQAHLADRHAGVGSSMDQRVWAARGPLLGAFLRSMKDVVIDSDTTKHAEKLAQDAERKFRVDVSATQYMAPGVHDAYEGFIRSLGEAGRTVVRWVEAAVEAPGGAAKSFGEIAKDVLPHLAPQVHPDAAPKLLELSRRFRGEGELARSGGVSGLNIDDVTSDANLTEIASVFQTANRVTDDERVALLALHRTRGELAAIGDDPLARADYFIANGPIIADAVSIVETGLRRRAGVVEKQAKEIWRSLAGSTDEAVWVRLGVDENATKPEDNAYVRAYQLFHDGDWNRLFRLADERAQLIVGGHEYNQGQAIISMLTRLYTEQLWTDFTHALYDMGVDLDVDKSAVKGVAESARLPKSYELGSRRGGRDAFAQRVLDNIQAEVGWKNREKIIEAPMPGQPRSFEPAEGATGPKGVEDLEAYSKAHQILHQLGWKYGKGAFDAHPVLLPDGSEVYLPQMMANEVAGVIDRVAKVGVAFADTTSSGAGIFGAGERRLARVVPPDAKTAAEIRMRQGARLGGAITGGVLGALAAGPIGAAAGAAFGSRLAPTMAETAQSFARTAAREAAEVGGEALARPAALAAGAVGAVAGAAKGSVGAAIGTLLSTFHTTTSLARVGMTTGLLIPNLSSFIGNLWGAFFQTYQVRGFSGALRAWGTNPRMLGDVVGRLWGDGPMRYRLGSKPIITPDGRILTAEMIAHDFVAHGLDSSFPKSESAEAIATDIARRIGTWPQRFLEDPADALGAGPRWLQHQLTEAWTSIDNMNRVAVYVDALHEGRSVAEAAELARLAAFDYGNLTDFERSVMRNTVLFYSFMRQNIRLFWHTMIHDPHRVLAQLRLAGGLQREFVEDEPYLTFPDYAQGRLVLDFRKAAIDAFGSQQGVATLSPPMPAMDVINLTSDLLGLALGDQEAAQEMAARAVPWVQGGIVAAFNIDPWSGRDLSGQSEVPQFLVEGDRMATGGIVVDSLLDVRRVFDETKGRYAYKAGNEKMWWFYRNVLQLPPAGRSMSTLEQIDRAAPFGSQPVSDVVGMLRTYREAGGNETLDAFFSGPANAAVTWAVGGDPLAPYVFEAPSNVDDLAAPRPGVNVGEERRKLLGFPTATIPTVEANADTIHAAIRRAAQKAGNKARSGEDFK